MRHGSVGQPGTSRYRDPDGDEPPVHDNVSQAFALDVAPSMPRGWIRPVPIGSVARTGGSLVSARFVVPSGGVFGAEVGRCCRGPWPRMW